MVKNANSHKSHFYGTWCGPSIECVLWREETGYILHFYPTTEFLSNSEVPPYPKCETVGPDKKKAHKSKEIDNPTKLKSRELPCTRQEPSCLHNIHFCILDFSISIQQSIIIYLMNFSLLILKDIMIPHHC